MTAARQLTLDELLAPAVEPQHRPRIDGGYNVFVATPAGVPEPSGPLPIPAESAHEAERIAGALTGYPWWIEFARAQADRFWSHVEKSDGCWLWKLGVDNDGYGKFQVSLPRTDGKQQQAHVRAHRLAHLLVNGPISDGLLVLHSCDNPPCCRPEHLSAGTQLLNRRQAKDRGRVAAGDRHGSRLHPERVARGDRHSSRTHPELVRRGQLHPNSKLTDEQVTKIRGMLAAGSTQRAIAVDFGVSQRTIWGIASGRRSTP